MKSIDYQKVIETIAQNAWTLLIVDSDGLIREAIGFSSNPSLEWEEQNKSRFQGCGTQYIPQKKLTLEELKGIVDQLAKAIKLFKEYKNNIPL